jgi:hypothetical protein
MEDPLRKAIIGPPLSPETIRRVDILFLPEDRERAKTLLYERCGNTLPFLEKKDMYQLERFRFAALKYSDGNIPMLEAALRLAQSDWRDLLMASGFAHDIEAHRRWEPKPAGEAAEIDPLHLAATIHNRLAELLIPLGFERNGDEWRRDCEVPQMLLVRQGLTSRTQTRFFLRITLAAKPVVVLHLPKLPRMDEAREQGYVFQARDSEEALAATVVEDVIRYAQPWFQRFASASEVRRGFEDGTFNPHLPVEGQAWMF